MSNDKINATQIEELDDELLEQAQGGFKFCNETVGLKSRLTTQELAGKRADGTKIRVADGVKLRDNGTKVRI